MQILLIGPNGSGKTTQAKLLSNYLQIPLIETGQILRDIVAEDSSLGREVKKIINSGVLVSDELISKIVKEKLEKLQNGFIATGFPRNLRQVEDLNINFDRVFYLQIPDEKVIERLTKRGREDDSREAIEKRLMIYHQQTEPLLDYYSRLGILENINADRNIEEIQEDLRLKLKWLK